MRLLRSQTFWTAAFAIVIALGFLGSRGIWDPDEGRYTNVALNMLDSGDWLNPRRHHEVGHWTKPPLTYWAIASSVAVFGVNPWAARLPSALSYLLCVFLVWRMARRLMPGSEQTAAVVYATMLFTVGASQLITTDYVLTAGETLAMWAFVEARFGHRGHSGRWLTLMWVGYALAFLTKGPPALLPLLVSLLFDQYMPGKREHRVLRWSGAALFAVLALPWYIAVIHGNPGLFEYFVGDEVVNRVTTNEFGRHGQWYGWIAIYVPTLTLGTLPWTASLGRWAHDLPRSLRTWWRDPDQRTAEASWLFVALWVLLPLVVFCLAKSRLPLYILPLFAPLALAIAMQRQRDGLGLPHWRWLLLWGTILLTLKLAAAYWPTHKDAAKWAEEVHARTTMPVKEIVFVEDMARYGMHLHLGRGVEIEKISLDSSPQPLFNPSYDDLLARELNEREPDTLWICKQELWPQLHPRIRALGYQATQLGAPYKNRIFFVVNSD